MTNPDKTSVTPIRFIRVLLLLGIGSVLALLVVWASLGRTVLEKTGTLLVLPCGIIWYLLTCCVVLAIAGRQRATIVATSLAWVSYTVCGSGHFACVLVRGMETPFANVDPLKEQPIDAVILLGGGGSIGANQRAQGNTSGDRVILAAQLYHAGITQKLICTGKRITAMDGEGPDASEVSKGILVGLGVPDAAIERLGGHNTSEEMQTLSKRFGDEGVRVGLVTSAWHLPRALRLARANGLDPVPLPADFIAGPDVPQTTAQFITSCIPQADNFFSVARIAKEHLAGLVGR